MEEYLEQKATNHTIILAGILSFVGLFIFFSIISFLMQGEGLSLEVNILSRPGGFFYIAFNWVSFFIPMYLFTSAYFLIAKSFKREFLLLQGLTIFPFLTLSGLIKLLMYESIGISPIKNFFVNGVGTIPGIIVFALLLALEALVIYQVYNLLLNKSGSKNKIKDYILSNLSVFKTDKKVDNSSVSNNPFSRQGNNEYKLDKIITERFKTEEFLEAKKKAVQITANKKEDSYSSENKNEDIIISYSGNQSGVSEKALKVSEPEILEEYEELEEVSEIEDSTLEKHGSLTVNTQYNLEKAIPVKESEIVDDISTDEQVSSADNNKIILHPNQPDKIQKKTAAGNIGHGNNKEYKIPVDELLNDYEDGEYWKIDTETKRYGETLMNTLMEFNIVAELTGIRKGPVITMFEILPSPGVKLSKIVGLADNIALRLAASRVRIVAPIPGKQAVGIEIPNKKRSIVSFKELITLEIFKKSKYELPIILGKDISGEAQIIDLVQTPHLLIAGATGSGKSVCVNTLISSLLFKKTPEEVRLLLIDPKMVELKLYNDIPHLLTPVITEPKRSFQALQYCLYEMERRYSLLDSIGVRDIRSFNKKIKEQKLATTKLPYIVIVIDEFADLMATTGKELESAISRLASMSRAVGIHLVLATQRPSVDVITGLIKANIPCRIAFMVASKFDSRIIIDSIGADKLLGQGDMLFASAWDPVPIRIQGSFLSEEEVENVTDHLKTLGEPDYIDDEIFFDDEEEEELLRVGSDDPLMEKALNIIMHSGKASTSYLQRRLKIGYNRAARIMEDLEARGIVGPPNGSKPREILHLPALS